MTKEEIRNFYSDKNIQWFISKFSRSILPIEMADIRREYFSRITPSKIENCLHDYRIIDEGLRTLSVLEVLYSYKTNLGCYLSNFYSELSGTVDFLREEDKDRKTFIIDPKKELVLCFQWYEESINYGELEIDNTCKDGLYRLISFIYSSVCIDYFDCKNLSGFLLFLEKITKEYNNLPLDIYKSEGFIKRKEEFKEVREILIKIFENSVVYYLPHISNKINWKIIKNKLILNESLSVINIYNPITNEKNVIYSYGKGNIFFSEEDLRRFQKTKYLKDYRTKLTKLENLEDKLKDIKSKISELEEELLWFDPQEKIRLGIPEDIEMLSE